MKRHCRHGVYRETCELCRLERRCGRIEIIVLSILTGLLLFAARVVWRVF